jgi:hypothetical protein
MAEQLKRYNIEALEKFTVRTFYTEVEAASPEEAIAIVQAGDWPYDDKRIEEGGEEWIRVVDIEEVK